MMSRGHCHLQGAAISLAAALLLSGCSACPRDPNRAGFFCGVNNIVAGVYEEDTARMSDEADSLERLVAELREDNQSLEGEIARLEGQQRVLRERQVTLNQDLAEQIERIEQLQRRRGADRGRLAALDQQVTDLHRRQREFVAAKPSEASEETLESIKADIEVLQRDIDEIYISLPQ